MASLKQYLGRQQVLKTRKQRSDKGKKHQGLQKRKCKGNSDDEDDDEGSEDDGDEDVDEDEAEDPPRKRRQHVSARKPSQRKPSTASKLKTAAQKTLPSQCHPHHAGRPKKTFRSTEFIVDCDD